MENETNYEKICRKLRLFKALIKLNHYGICSIAYNNKIKPEDLEDSLNGETRITLHLAKTIDKGLSDYLGELIKMATKEKELSESKDYKTLESIVIKMVKEQRGKKEFVIPIN